MHLLLFSIFDVLRIFEALQKFFNKFLLKWGKNEADSESSIFFEAQKYYLVFESRLNFFSNGHISNVVWTLPNVVKIDVENGNLFWRCLTLFNSTLKYNVVSFSVDLTLCDIATSYEPNNNVGFLTLVKFLSVFCVNTLIINYYFNSGSQLSNLQDYLLIIILKYNFPLYTFYQLL